MPRCACGYSFEQQHDGVSEQAAQEEELFAAYLSARVEQALNALEATRSQLAAQPGFDKALEVMRALQELRALRSEFETRAPNAAASGNIGGAPGAEPNAEFRAQQAERAAKIAETIRAAVSRTPQPYRRAAGPAANQAHAKAPETPRRR